MSINNKSEIKFEVELDDNKVPEQIHWSAKDQGIDKKNSKAILISVWDHKLKESLRIDLWTKDMPLDEMKRFYHQTLLSLADTFERATNDHKMTETMRDFCDYFAEKLKL